MYTLEFTTEQLMLIDKALQGLTFREAAPIIGVINEQVMAAQRDTEAEVEV